MADDSGLVLPLLWKQEVTSPQCERSCNKIKAQYMNDELQEHECGFILNKGELTRSFEIIFCCDSDSFSLMSDNRDASGLLNPFTLSLFLLRW